MDQLLWNSGRYSSNNYKRFEDGQLVLWHTGFIFSLSEKCVEYDVLKIAHSVIDGTRDFNDLHGFYRVVIYVKNKDALYFWGDNCGTQLFFIDKQEHTFSDSMRSLCEKRSISPNFNAIYQLLSADYIFTCDTIVDGIQTTDPEYYYVCRDNEICAYNKGLRRLSDLAGLDLQEYMSIAVNTLSEDKICAVCTGGTDSRTILAHLIYLGKKPDLVITGRDDNPDIPIAKAIAQVLQLDLTVIPSPVFSDGWFDAAMDFSDYYYDPIASFRHLKKMNWAINNGYKLEYGGVGGEFYKNRFCRALPENLSPKDAMTTERIIQAFFRPMISTPPWLCSSVNECKTAVLAEARTYIETHREETRLLTYNRIGERVLQKKAQLITNNYTCQITKVDPLTDRDIIAKASREIPLRHVLHRWQRWNVSTYCPQIKAIKTDQGYSLDISFHKIVSEGIFSLTQKMKRAFLRVKRKLHIKPKQNKTVKSLWNADYQSVIPSEEFQIAFQRCKEIGIIRPETKVGDIPPLSLGNILLIGYVFGKRNNSEMTDY